MFSKIYDLNIRFEIGAPPTGGGEVHFTCPVRRLLKPLLWEQWGLVKRIRGVVYALRVSPAIANRMVESSKGVSKVFSVLFFIDFILILLLMFR